MKKIKIAYMFTMAERGKEYWICKDERTNRFYKTCMIKAPNNDLYQSIEEVPENFVDDYVYSHQDELLQAIHEFSKDTEIPF